MAMSDGVTDGLRTRLAAPRIAVLGPAALGPPDALRPLGGRAARVLLALAAASRPSGLEVLADVVWGAERPASYRPALHVHLGHLRRALDELGGGARIVRSNEGYALETGECELDDRLAVALLDEARASLAEDPSCARWHVEAALDLWRGAPYTVDDEVVVPTAGHHLEALHRDAEELRVEVLLLAGEARAAEEAAMHAVELEPLREHRWGQLLRARYLAGRTAEALATYQDARAALVEALGIEPGPELRDLEAAVLTHDVARLRLPVTPREELGPPPPATGCFVGREDEVRRAAATITSNRRLLVLGPPGVGKSRLAVEVTGHLGLDTAWADVGSGVSAAVAIDWSRRHPDGLVVLDNAEEDVEAVAATVEELARSTPGVSILVTSRLPIAVDSPVEVLGPLATPDPDADDEEVEGCPAVVALRAALRELAPAVSLSPVEAAALARRAGGLPLAIRLAAATARTLPATSVLALPASDPDDEIDRATRAVLRVLDDEAREVFIDLTVLRGAFDLDVAAGVTGLGPEQTTGAILVLADHGLLQARPDRTDPFTILEPLAAAGQRLLAGADRAEDAADRLADTCLARARALDRISWDAEPTDLEARLRSDLSRHRQALDHLAHRRDAERALALACRLEFPLYALGWWREKAELFDRALAIPGGPSPMRARAHALHARPGPLHLIDPAEAERAEQMASSLGHETLRAFAGFIRALHLMWSGNHGLAAEIFHEARQVFEREGNGFLACDATKFLGVTLVLDGDADAGLELQRDALARVRRDHPSPFHAAHALAWLGHCHRLLGDDAAAFADWTQGRALAGRIGNRTTAAHIAIGLGELAVERGDTEDALALSSDALDLLAAGNVWTYEPWAWTVALRAHLAAEDLGAATACGRRAAAGLARVPPGESVRFGTELAAMAIAARDEVAAARILGVVAVTPDRRELPFPSPAEAVRRDALRRTVEDRLGTESAWHLEAGSRCSLAEAAGRLLA
jgi:DNA-binding SARP family transcriptional activator/tetratricopeptide (TPR) repeat protein